MNVVEEMKEAKLRYLADVMGRYAKYICETSSNQHIADRIDEFAKTILDVVNMGDGHFVIEKTLDIRKLENKMKIQAQLYYQGIPDYRHENLENAKRAVEDNLLHFIRKNKLIDIKVEDDGHGIPIVTASLYVGIRPQAQWKLKEQNQ